MRILVVGAGATGGYFGGRLAQAGRDVTFLVREGRARTLRERGLRIVGPGEERIAIEPQLVTAGEISGAYDLVLLTVKESGLRAALDDVAPAIGPGTRIMPFLNGMRHIDLLVDRFGEEAVLGGVAVVIAELDENGDVLVSGGPGALTYGARGGRPDSRVAEVHKALSGAGFGAAWSDAIDVAMWSKWVFIASIGAVNVLGRGTVGEVATAPGGSALAETAVAEAAAVAREAGFPAHDEDLERCRAMVTDRTSSGTSSLFRDLTAGFPVEAEQIFGDLVARAAKLGVAVPLLDAVTVQLRVHNARVA